MNNIKSFITNNKILNFIPRLIILLVPIFVLFLVIYDLFSTKENFEGDEDEEEEDVLEYDPDNLDTSYNESGSTDLSNINFFNDNQYYSSENATTYTNSNYVPSYEDTVYLTRSSLVSNSKPIYDSPSSLAGFCDYTHSNPSKTEEICNKIDNEVCASTTCCVLLGGEKCVAGNKNGPIMTENYNNPDISHKDHYYFNGKCFGNCINPTEY
tara:strand:- start:359 stop:991 length:633 start_codon:yes stop_codon:yes gene_type:complete